MRTLLRKIKFRHFNQEFGFEPTSKVDVSNTRIGNAEQMAIYMLLRQLAENFKAADDRERELLISLSGATDPEKILEVRRRLQDARSGLIEAKRRFWHAHGLAKKNGFSVERNYTDYLPSKWR